MNRHLYLGLAALAGTLILFVLWLAQYERHAAIERIERYEVPHTSGMSR